MYTAAENRYENMKYLRCGDSGLMLPALSLGLWHNFGDTGVYSNMEEMCFTAFDNGITHFDPNPQPHAHFYCKKCKQVSDIFIEDYNKVVNVFANQTNNEIEKCNVFLEGVCELCKNKTDA